MSYKNNITYDLGMDIFTVHTILYTCTYVSTTYCMHATVTGAITDTIQLVLA